MVIRLKKPDVRTHVICPGILYGDGEDDGGFHPLWKLSWEAKEDLDVLGAGDIGKQPKGSLCGGAPCMILRQWEIYALGAQWWKQAIVNF